MDKTGSSSLVSLAEITGQVIDQTDPIAVNYRKLLAAKLDPEGTAQQAASTEQIRKRVQVPVKEAVTKIGILE